MPNEHNFNSRLMKLYTVSYQRRSSLTTTETVERCYRTKDQVVNDVKELMANVFVTVINVTDNFGNNKVFYPTAPSTELQQIADQILNTREPKKRQQHIHKLHPTIRVKIERMLDEPTQKAMKDVWSWVDEYNAKPTVDNFIDKDHQLAARKIRNLLEKIEVATGRKNNRITKGGTPNAKANE